MPGIALLRWWSGTKPTVSRRQGWGKRPNQVAAPPSVGQGPAGGGGALAAGPESSSHQDGDLQSQNPSARLGPLSRLHLIVQALAVPSLQLAGRLLGSKPWEPLQEQLQQQLAGMEAIKDACAALHVETLQDLQDVLGSLILSECVYKVLDMEDFRALQAINNLKAYFPPQLVTLRRVQWALPHAQHSFLMAESPDALYVAFMGTKRPRDLVTNVNVYQDQILFDAAAGIGSPTSSMDGAADDGAVGPVPAGAAGSAAPAAHRGFSSRAKTIPIEALYYQAWAHGKRLVLCGHSLGGAVAQLCTIRLLQQLPPSAHNTVSCIGFATPPVGNQALAELVTQNEWRARLRNYLLPEDPIPRLLSSRQPPPAASESNAVVAANDAPAGTASSAAGSEPALPAASSAAAALASVSVHSDSLPAESRRKQHKGPRLPHLGDALPWVRRSSRSRVPDGPEQCAGTAGAAGSELQRGDPASPMIMGTAGLMAPEAGRRAARPAGQAAGLANNIAAAPKLGRQQVSRLQAAAPLGIDQSDIRSERSNSSSGGTSSIIASTEAQEQAPPNVQCPGVAVGLEASSEAVAIPAGLVPSPAGSASAGSKLTFELETSAESGSLLTEGVEPANLSGSTHAPARKRRGRWPVPRPPLKAVAQSAQAAARLVTFPLAVAASVPGRVTPQYHDLAQTLYVLPDEVATSRPPPTPGKKEANSAPMPTLVAAAESPPGEAKERSFGLPGPLAALQLSRLQPFGRPMSFTLPWQPTAAAAGEGSSSSEESDSDVEQDAAAAAQAVAAAAAAGSGDAEVKAGVHGNTLAPTKLPPRTLFPMHRMLSYRNRILGIVAGSLNGRVWLPALPHFANVPHPDDVSLSLLLAPGLFPLKAEATVAQPATDSVSQPASLAGVAAEAPGAASTAGSSRRGGLELSSRLGKPGGQSPSMGGASGVSHSSMDGLSKAAVQPSAAEGAGRRRRRRQRWGLLRLFRRQGGGDEGAPVELEVRVDGRGLHTVNRVWLEGGLPVKDKRAAREGDAGAITAKIVWQPPPPSPATVQRPPMPAIMSPVTSFLSWIAVSFGWVRLLRRLQPAGKQDFLVAKVLLPAAVVERAQLAASNPIQAAVNDAQLPGVRVGPKLTMHLQSDFAKTSVPLDIRAAADLEGQLGWIPFLPHKWWQ